MIDWLAKWRIAEPRQFIRNNGSDFRNRSDVIVVDPSGEFFKAMRGGPLAPATPAPPTAPRR